jgi:hypothetical protein
MFNPFIGHKNRKGGMRFGQRHQEAPQENEKTQAKETSCPQQA